MSGDGSGEVKPAKASDPGGKLVRWIRTGLMLALAGLMIAVAGVAFEIVNHQTGSVTSGHRYISELGAEATSDLLRLAERATGFGKPGADKTGIGTQAAALAARLARLHGDPLAPIIAADPELSDLAAHIIASATAMVPLAERIEQPRNRERLIQVLEQLGPDVARLVSLSNKNIALAAASDQKTLTHLHTIFAWLLIGVCGCAAILAGIVMWMRRRFVQQLLAAKEVAEAANVVRSRFLANMSHELRTPMNGVLGMIELIRQGGLTEEQRRFAEIAHQSGKVTLDLIATILDFSRLESGHLILEEHPVDVGAVANDVVGMMRAEAITKGLSLTVSLAAGLPVGLLGDAGRLRQVLTALMGNAVKFTQGGEIGLSVTVEQRSEAMGALLRFEITDTGIGIAAGQVSRIFEAFAQADTSSTRQKGGAGLGLTIARHLVELMGGRIGVTSQPSRGSAFWFTVPFRQENVNDLALDPGPVAGLSVLLVCGEDEERAVLAGFLEAWEIRPMHAESGARAIKLASRALALGRGFDQILMSEQLPDMSAQALARALCDEASGGDVAMTVLSRDPADNAVTKRLAIYEALSAAAHNATARAAAKRDAAARISAREAAARHEAERTEIPALVAAVAAETPAVMVDASPAPIRALLVEDNAVNRLVAREFLKRAGCSVDMARHGREAVDRCQESIYDIIFMDCQMPEMDGFEATRIIRKQQNRALARVPIVALTANAMDMDREHCIEAGMDDFLVKPANQVIIVDALRRWVPRAFGDWR